MTRLAIRRFPDEVTRKRSLPGMYNDFGEYVTGAVRETIFRCSVQPRALDDDDQAGGAQLTERLRIYVPTGDGGAIITLDRFLWGDDVFKWGEDTFRGQSREYVNESGALLRAAFEDSVADRTCYDGTDFVIEESRSWPSHTRATALRQT